MCQAARPTPDWRRIKENAGYHYSSNTSTSFDTINKFQPRVPMWRASGLAVYRWNDKLSTSVGARYSGKQYSQLGNYDVNGFTYTGVSNILSPSCRFYQSRQAVVRRCRHRQPERRQYWNYHLYPGRTVLAELKWTH
jgi:iron complex outermembrane receptor protein